MAIEHPPDPAEPTPEADEPEPFWRHAAREIGGLLLGRLRVIHAVVPLTFGGILLAGAWDWGATAWRQRDDLATLTGRGEARVEESWWRIDFDPAPLGADGTNWRDLTHRQLCSRFRFVPASGGGPVSVVCRTIRGLDDGRSLLDVAGPELPVRWLDVDGRPELDLRFSARAEEWLAARPALWWPLLPQDDETRAGYREGSELEALLLEADLPVELLASAAAPVPTVVMAFDPARPARALPEAALGAARRGFDDLAFLPYLALAGVLLWSVGCWIFTFGAPAWVRAAVLAGSLLLVPWWSGHLHRALGFLWAPAGGLFVLLGPEMVGVPSVVMAMGEGAGSADDWKAGAPGDRRRPLSFATSHYADVLAEVAGDLEPAALGGSADEVLRASVELVDERVLALPEDRRAALLEALYRHGRLDAHGADLLFFEAVHRISLDSTRPALAQLAALVLSDMATGPVPVPGQPGWRERRRLWQLLLDHPEPIVFNMARYRGVEDW